MRLGELARIARGDWWVTPRYNDYITYKRNLADERAALMTILDRPERVRVNTFSASAAGRCLRERQLTYLGYPRLTPDAKAMNIFANGDFVHLRHQTAGLVGGYIEEAEVPVEYPDLWVTGTMDAKLAIDAGLEIKSINERGFSEVNTLGVKHEHRMQVHAYMLASGLDLFYVVYENKNTNALREFKVEKDQKTLDEVVQEFTTLKQATQDKVLLPMLPECLRKEGRYRRCQFREVCPLATFVHKGPARVRIAR